MRLTHLALCLVALASSASLAQTPGDPPPGDTPPDNGAPGGFEAYPAYNEISAITSGLGRLWAAAPGGIFSYDPVTGETTRTTTTDGLRGGDVQTLTVDEARGTVWAGYADGVLDRLSAGDGEVRTFFDIERNVQFAARGVRRLRVRGDTLYAATDFGLVVFDLDRSEVRNTYARLTTLPAATPVSDFVFAPLPNGRPGLWLATEGGVVYADAASPALQTPTAWTLDPGFAVRAVTLALFPGPDGAPAIHVAGGSSSARDLYIRRPDGSYARVFFFNQEITELVPYGDRLLTLNQFAVQAVRAGQVSPNVRAERAQVLTGLTVGPTGRAWASDASLGLFGLPEDLAPAEPVVFPPDPVIPPGPFSNDFVDIDVAPDGAVWGVTAQVAASQTAAIARLDADTDEWTALLPADEPEIGRALFRSINVGPDNTVYAGKETDGLVVIDPDGTVTRYDQTNSTLSSPDPVNLPAFVPVSDVAFEGRDRWVANQEASGPVLHLFDEDDTWTGIPFPQGTSRGQGRATIAIDRQGNKWLNIGSGGLVVFDTGADPADPADDRGRQYRGVGEGGQGLPNATVRDVVVDGSGLVWIGTLRGLATVFPESAFSPNPDLGLPQWTLTPPGPGGERDFFLRDVEVNDLDVDPSGRVWVATNTGAYLVEPAPGGSGYVIARQIDAATSPLSDDRVLRIAVRPTDGRVFLTTPVGVFSAAGDATQATASSEALRASPSPFRPAEAPGGVVVSGLAAARSTVRVLTLAGERLFQADVAGGSFRWNGRDERTGDLVSSGVYLVTATDATGRALVGKIAVIR